MSWKISEQKYNQIMTLGKISIPAFVIARGLIIYTTSGTLGFWLALVTLVSVPAIGFSALVWLWEKIFGIEQKPSTSAESRRHKETDEREPINSADPDDFAEVPFPDEKDDDESRPPWADDYGEPAPWDEEYGDPVPGDDDYVDTPWDDAPWDEDS